MGLFNSNKIFTPFRLLITPKWDVILKDFGWLKKDELGNLLKYQSEFGEENPKYKLVFNPLVHTLRYTFLQEEIIHEGNYEYFSSTVDFDYFLDVEFLKKKGHQPHFIFTSDRLGLKQVKNYDLGYKLAITTPVSSLKPKYDYSYASDQNVISILPYSFFWPYYKQNLEQRYFDQRDQQLRNLGWIPDEDTGVYNKYFVLNLSAI